MRCEKPTSTPKLGGITNENALSPSSCRDLGLKKSLEERGFIVALSIIISVFSVGCIKSHREAFAPSKLPLLSSTQETAPVVSATVPVCLNSDGTPIALLSQHVTADQINAFLAKHPSITWPYTCRWQQPPMCYIGQKKTYQNQCTK